MKGRLVLAIVSTILEEIAIVAIVLWGLPKIGFNLPLWSMIVLMVVWGAYSIVIYRMGSHALRKVPLINLPNMVGSKGKVVSPLAPEGLIKIKGELWIAISEDGEIGLDREVMVIEQNSLKLLVRADGKVSDLGSLTGQG